MFKEYYKAANNDIETSRELLGVIFKKAEEAHKEKKKPIKIYRWGTAFAAVFVVVLAVAVYPRIEKTNEQPKLLPTEQKEQTVDVEPWDEKPLPKETEKKTVPENTEQFSYQNESIAEDFSADTKNEAAVADEEGANSQMKFSRMAEPQYDTTKKTLLLSELESVAEEEEKRKIEEALHMHFSAAAPDDKYSFIIFSKGEVDGRTVYAGSWNRVFEDHFSRLTNFVVYEGMKEMYEFESIEDSLVWSTENNLLSN